MSQTAGRIVLVGTLWALCLSACSKKAGSDSSAAPAPSQTSIATLVKTNPSQACVSPEMRDGLKSVILQNVFTSPWAKERLQDAVQATTIELASVVFDSYDKDTERLSCTGDITVSLPSDIAKTAGVTNASDRVSYSAQPDASGSGYVFELPVGDNFQQFGYTLDNIYAPHSAPDQASNSTSTNTDGAPATSPNNASGN